MTLPLDEQAPKPDQIAWPGETECDIAPSFLKAAGLRENVQVIRWDMQPSSRYLVKHLRWHKRYNKRGIGQKKQVYWTL